MQDKIPAFFYLKIFFLIIILLVIGSFLTKVIGEVVHSSFTNNSFSLLLVSRDSKLVSLDKKAKSMRFISLGDMRNYVKGKNPLGASIALGIPINGIIVADKNVDDLTEFVTSDNELKLMFDNTIVRKNVNSYDIFKMMNAIRGMPKDNKEEIKVAIFDEADVKEKLSEAFLDSEVKNSELTMEIENATSINGLGNIFALILSREGYNVINVRTSEEVGNSYVGYAGPDNSYISSLVGLTGFARRTTGGSHTADVTIFIGEDVDAMLSP